MNVTGTSGCPASLRLHEQFYATNSNALVAVAIIFTTLNVWRLCVIVPVKYQRHQENLQRQGQGAAFSSAFCFRLYPWQDDPTHILFWSTVGSYAFAVFLFCLVLLVLFVQFLEVCAINFCRVVFRSLNVCCSCCGVLWLFFFLLGLISRVCSTMANYDICAIRYWSATQAELLYAVWVIR